MKDISAIGKGILCTSFTYIHILGVPVIFVHMWLSWCFAGGRIKE